MLEAIWNCCIRREKDTLIVEDERGVRKKSEMSDLSFSSTRLPSESEELVSIPPPAVIAAAEAMGDRDKMEDVYCIREDPEETFLGVFDGHAGARAAHYAKDAIYEKYKELKKVTSSMEDALHETFEQTDVQFLKKALQGDDEWGDGTTATVCIIKDGILTVANCGDSEVLIGKQDGYKIITELHRLSNKDEQERVKEVTGKTLRRVEHPMFPNCSLSVTRAIGDVYFKDPSLTMNKPSGLIATPHVTSIPLKSGSFVLLGTDGLFEMVKRPKSYEFLYSFIKKMIMQKTPQDVIEKLVRKAAKESDDNCTAILYIVP